MKKILLIIFTGYSLLGYSQTNGIQGANAFANLNPKYHTASPNASTLGVYGEVPVNLSTGQINLSIPLYDLKYHDISVPINLSYNYTGFKPNEPPSWVGLGWCLNAGGVITRIKHGEVDEAAILDPGGSNPCSYSFNYLSSNLATSSLNALNINLINGNPWGYTKLEDLPNSTILYNQNILIQNQGIKDYQCANSSYGNMNDTEPDEFVFNFNGNTGKIFLSNGASYTSDPIIQTSSNNIYRVTYELGYDLNSGYNAQTIKRYIKKITLYSYDGYVYEFGGAYSNHNIELTLEPNSGKFGNTGYPSDKGNNQYVSSWYLTKITSPQGAELNLSYDVLGYQATLLPALDLEQFYLSSQKHTNYNTYSIAVNTTVYLKEINAGDTRIEFNNETTHVAVTPSSANNYHNVNYDEEISPKYIQKLGVNVQNQFLSIMYDFDQLYDICDPDWNIYPTFINHRTKLSEINIYEKNSLLKQYSFLYDKNQVYDLSATSTNYISPGNSKSGRLELKEIKLKDALLNDVPFYSFEYYLPATFQNMPKIGYGTRKVDHWGYLNGVDEKDYFYDQTANQYKDTGLIYLIGPNANVNQNDYYQSREPYFSKDACEIGALATVTYPTGGKTSFFYEQNSYRKRVEYNSTSNSIDLFSEPSNVTAGGLRISYTQNWESSNYYNNPPIIKHYYYCNDYPNCTISSGVLNSGKPNYVTNGIANLFSYQSTPFQGSAAGNTLPDYFRLADNSEFPNTFEGNYLTYSKVIEKNDDNSYKTYVYSNSDVSNDYLDEVKNFTNGQGLYPNGYPFQIFYSKASERGKLLNESFYTSQNQLVKRNIFTYNDDPYRFGTNPLYFMKKNTRMIPALDLTVYSQPFEAVKCYMGRIDAYDFYVKSKTEEDYFNNTNSPLSTTTIYHYDNYRNVTLESVTNSNNVTNTTSIKYANDYNSLPVNTSDDLTESVKYLYNNKFYSLPIEKTSTVTKNGQTDIVGGDIIEYDIQKPLLKAMSKLELDAPSPILTFVASHVQNGSVVKDSRYNTNITNVLSYNNGSVRYPVTIEDHKRKFTTLRDYNQTLITAVIDNAENQDVAQCSFEGDYSSTGTDDNKGNWVFDKNNIISGGLTGVKSYNLNGSSISSLSGNLTVGKSYRLSFWVKPNSGTFSVNNGSSTISTFLSGQAFNNTWYYKECEFVANAQSISISGTAQIDEVRLCPVEARMETYTFLPNVGMLSKCDASNKMVFYKYDSQQRLYLISDDQGNIIKKYSYGLRSSDN